MCVLILVVMDSAPSVSVYIQDDKDQSEFYYFGQSLWNAHLTYRTDI